LYAGEFAPGFASLVKPARELRPRADDLVLYHHGIASHLSGMLLHLPCRRGIVYHNITPARFYEGTPLWEALTSGRAQLSAMAPFVDVAIGVSRFNCDELTAAGYRNVHTVPLFVEPRRFGADRVDPMLLDELSDSAPAILCVGRVVPHKRVEDVLSLHAELLRLRPAARLWIVGARDLGNPYVRKVARLAKRLARVKFFGRISQGQLVAAYRAASALISMSEHEGFGLPLLEGMAADVPVVAYAATAVPETLGGSGIAFTEKRYALLAELIDELARDAALRGTILRGQRTRLKQLSADSAARLLDEALATCVRRANGARWPHGARPSGARRPNGARRRSEKPRVAIVVQRFGNVIGGAETHARMIARRLSGDFDITVLTTCATDHLTWANKLAPGEDRSDGIRVIRFPTAHTRAMRSFNRLSRELFLQPNDRMREEQWVAEQGPAAPDLLEHISRNARAYDGFIFFTYLYCPTVWGEPLVADRAILVPTAHDEPPLRFDLYADVFERPRALFCNTPEEAALVRSRFPRHARIRVVGVGIESARGDPARFRQKYELDRPYLMYVGRMEAGKGIPELIRAHGQLWRADREAPMLLLAGSSDSMPEGPGLRYLGMISDEDKTDGLSGALAAVVPSRYESLSLLALEAFAQHTPILGNAESEVLRGQVQRSSAGATYENFESYRDGIRQIAAERGAMGLRALKYARQHTWPRVLSAYREEMADIMENAR
jgi:glycosyltransferase involved in cell wall biosynthesis